MSLIMGCTFAVMIVLLFGMVTQTKQSLTMGDFVYDQVFSEKNIIYFAFFSILVFTSTARYGFVDTYAYKEYYLVTNHNMENVINEYDGIESGWLYFNYLLNFISSNPKTILFVSAAIIIGAYVYTIKKFSVDPIFSMFLFYCLTYMDTNNGLRQMVASALIMLAYPLLQKRKLWGYLLFAAVVYLAMQFHSSAVVSFAIALVVMGKELNIRTIAALSFGIIFMVVPQVFDNLFLDWFEDSKYISYIGEGNGMSLMRMLAVGAVPAAFTGWHLYNIKRYNMVLDANESMLLNLCIVNSMFVFMGLYMAYWFRFAFYTSFAPMIMMPKYIRMTFNERIRGIIKFIAVICYLAFFLYNIHVNSTYGTLIDFRMSWE